MEQVDIQQQQLAPDRGVLIKTRTLCPLYSLILLLQIQSRAWFTCTFNRFYGRQTPFSLPYIFELNRPLELIPSEINAFHSSSLIHAIITPSPPPLPPPPSAGLSRGSSMGKPLGGDCDLVLANRSAAEGKRVT